MHARLSLWLFTLVMALMVSSGISWSQDTLRIVTWNIEHLGSPGRGLGGIGAGNLPLRSDEDLQKIALFIRDRLHADVLALQEIAIARVSAAGNGSAQLDRITEVLGAEWAYHIGNPGSGEIAFGTVRNLQNAFLWNTKTVRLVKGFDLPFPNEVVGNKSLFDRRPLVGYFQALKDGQDTNDFVLVNVHLTSGQENDENHLAAMVIIEQNITHVLKQQNFRESDRIILGDFNDNPFATTGAGEPRFLDLLYRYMAKRRYTNQVTVQTGFTRMDSNRSSIIDHVLVNKGASVDLASSRVTKVLPLDTSDTGLALWRRSFSDHFPLVIALKVRTSDNDVD